MMPGDKLVAVVVDAGIAADQLTACLGLDREDTCGTDDHVIQIEPLGQHVVER